MKITKALLEQLHKLQERGTFYLLGAKTEDAPYSIAVLLEHDGGCKGFVPAVEKTVISSAMFKLLQDGYESVTLAWTPAVFLPTPKALDRSLGEVAAYLRLRCMGKATLMLFPKEKPYYIEGSETNPYTFLEEVEVIE